MEENYDGREALTATEEDFIENVGSDPDPQDVIDWLLMK